MVSELPPLTPIAGIQATFPAPYFEPLADEQLYCICHEVSYGEMVNIINNSRLRAKTRIVLKNGSI